MRRPHFRHDYVHISVHSVYRSLDQEKCLNLKRGVPISEMYSLTEIPHASLHTPVVVIKLQC